MKKSFAMLALGALSSLMLATSTLAASNDNTAKKPGQWTFGIGVLGAYLPDYQGADESRSLILPFPYIHYKSNKLTIDRDGIKRKLWDSEHLELTFTGQGSINVDSKDNATRNGMPDLGWVGAMGPALNWYIQDNKSAFVQISMMKAYAFDGGVEDIGWRSEASINWSSSKFPFMQSSKVYYVAKARLKYDSSSYNHYYYGVDSQYTTATRPTYQADSGYSGSQFLLGVNFEAKSYRAGVFARYNNIAGATFENSSLVKQQGNFAVGFAYAWLFDW